MQKILDHIKNKHPKSDYIDNDDENLINVKLPNEYIDIPEFRDVPGHKKVDYVIGYFNDILNDNFRISVINGAHTSNDGPHHMCDYCETFIEKEFNYYYCYDCHLDMCHLCFGETNKEISKLNGIEHWHKRAETLARCREHDLRVRYFKELQYYCDLCRKDIYDIYRYSNCEEKDDNCEDLCQKCTETEMGKKFIEDNKLILTENIIECGYEFGSMLDWIPILRDDEYNLILYNCNPESELCNRLACVSSDNHGRMGFYTVKETIDLDELLDKLEEYYSEGEWKKLKGWEEFYNYPIKRFMQSQNIPVHYG